VGLGVEIGIDHLNILTENWDATVEFYHQLFGFIEGKHIPDGRKNYLYTADGRHAWIHLSTLESKARRLADPNSPFQIQATPGSQNQNTGALDHVAWAVASADFDVLLNKLDALKIEYRISQELPRQIWFFDPNGVKLEITDCLNR
jgi:catechol 2,3-dioxygenase-like lactoylglutathione lyase family enzyme